ncbi:sigma-70 family RNA polymerase sigma factor [Saccharibacillus endophyticus]|uniref:RNA polymerase sigma factor RpoD n=1 Tax=Saccharibacillus endophyticus TaxID=2060666 RepID=A0ABQ1ZSD9_9BACL|nr:sigma-70 family RNA polymerase sigma factor [Saccharibacillus endophyticus]GGH76754.1 RNA polymerase sigma factor RpoD [Saccharibacillus endophyticus]
MSSALSQQMIIDKLYALYKQNGYLREEDALDLMITENTPLVRISRITDKLIEMGVIFLEDFSNEDDEEYYDRAQVDYDSIYKEVLKISPQQEIFISYLREVRPAQNNEWRILLKQISDGNNYAYSRLFEMHLRVVVRIALRYAKDENIELDDAIQEGAMGLMRAIEKFDQTQHENFGSYSPLWIQQYISRAVADTGRTIRIPVHMLETMDRIRKSKKKLVALHSSEPNLKLLSIESGISIKKIRESVRIIKNISGLLSLEELAENMQEDNVFNCKENSYSIDKAIEYIFLRQDLIEVMKTLKSREAKVLLMRFGLVNGLEYTLEEIGAEFAVTRERIRQIEVKSLVKMRSSKSIVKLKDYI